MITAHKDDLVEALRVMRPVSRGTLHDLQAFAVLSPSNGGVALSVDAITEYASLTLPGSCEDLVALPLALLDRILTYAEGSEVTMQPVKGKLQLKCGATSAWLPLGDLPKIRKFTPPASRIPMASLVNGLRVCHPVCITQGPSCSLPGIHVSGGIMEATDGRAMHRYEVVDLPEINCILHPAISELVSILRASESIGVVYNGSFSVHGTNSIISIQPLAYEYPDIGDKMPAPSENVLEVDTAALKRVMRVCHGVLGKSGHANIYAAYDGVVVETSPSEFGSVSEMIPVTSNRAKSFRIDPARMLAALGQIKEATVKIQCDDSNLPIRINEGLFTAVIATMRTA